MTVRRVVVTGLGLVTPLGCGVELVWGKIIKGMSGIGPLKGPGFERLPCRVGGRVPLQSEEGGLDLDRRFTEAERRSASMATIFALAASEEAVKDSHLLATSLSEEKLERIGVGIGMGMLDLQDVQTTGDILNSRGYSRVTPYFVPRILPNLAAGQVSIKYGFQGPNHCASTACASGAHSIGDSFNFIRHNHADVMVCGGTEACISPLSIAAFCRLRALSTKFNADPTKASRPFDTKRDGFVMGEGSGILVLEELERALARGARIYAEVLGYGLSGDANHLTAAREDGRGAFRSMKQALDMGRIQPQQLSYINCHATSTPIGDRAEIGALRALFKSETAGNVPISSTKGSHGHLLGAAGSVESILTILSGYHKVLPPSLNIDDLEEDFKKINIVRSVECRADHVDGKMTTLKNSFGFGGTNASLCFSSFLPE